MTQSACNNGIMKRNGRKTLTVLVLLLVLKSALFSQVFEELYPKQYKEALAMKSEYEALFKADGVDDPDFYIAIVFPEMTRYTETRNDMEVLLTKITYTTIGQYEGCSLGPFQMKPSFARDVEKAVATYHLEEKYPEIVYTQDDTVVTRYERIMRIQDRRYQRMYLRAFVDICRIRFNLEGRSKEEQLKIIAGAYNAGVWKDIGQLMKLEGLKCFPYGRNSAKSLWNYADLVIYFYKEFTGN